MAGTRKLAVTVFTSLDGVIESPEKWSFPYWNDEIGKFKLEETRASDALLLGRAAPILEYPCWAAPLVSHGLLYLRGKDRLIILRTQRSQLKEPAAQLGLKIEG